MAGYGAWRHGRIVSEHRRCPVAAHDGRHRVVDLFVPKTTPRRGRTRSRKALPQRAKKAQAKQRSVTVRRALTCAGLRLDPQLKALR